MGCKKLYPRLSSDRKIFAAVVGFGYQLGKAVVQMMMTIESYIRRGRVSFGKWITDRRFRLLARVGLHFFGGLVLSAAGLAGKCQPLTMGLLCSVRGWPAAVLAAGGGAGYYLFWGAAGLQGLLWLALALPVVLLLGRRRILEESPMLMSAISALIVSASGLIFQVFMEDTTSVPLYLLRVLLGGASTKLFQLVRDRRDPVADWLASGVGVLALAQILPFGKFSLGYVAAGMLAAGGAFPAAALAGLALDLSVLTRTPMTAVLCLAYLARMIPYGSRWLRFFAPGAVYILVMSLCGNVDYGPLPGLAVGGALAVLLPPKPELTHRRGETGMAQVRLELMSGVLFQTQQLLLEEKGQPIDEEAIMARTRERACGSCPCRKTCRVQLEPLPPGLLHRPLMDTASLTVPCKKPARMILELRRSQEQLRAIKADRERQADYRAALVQQYQFLGNFLQQLADQLPTRGHRLHQQYRVEVEAAAAGREETNGDRLLWFAGTGCKYYILLCDGMGTGIGAAQEGQSAAAMLRQMLCAGFPAEYALRSVNSLLALRGRAGAVTVDLAEVFLDSGRVMVYKWGAPASYLLREDGTAEKIGTAGPPPGLSVRNVRETTQRLSLRRGEVLIMTSDGVDGEDALRRLCIGSEQPPGDLAAKILECGAQEPEDDATVAVVRLISCGLST